MAKDNVSPLGSLEDISNARKELMKFNIDERVNKTLHLVLKRKWWDMIASGEKKEEYREVCHYWARRLLNEQYCWYTLNTDYPKDFLGWIREHLDHRADIQFRPFDKVCFHLGYTNTTMIFRIEYFMLSMGKEEWGAEPNKYYFVIKLGERIE